MAIMNRRTLCLAALGGTLMAGLGTVQSSASDTTRFLSAGDDVNGDHSLLGIGESGQVTYRLAVPERAHEARVISARLAIYFARRPGRQCYIVDLHDGALITTLNAEIGQHFCGHGCLSNDGRYLLLTAYAYDRRMGIVAIHETAPPFRKLTQFDTHGLDPHQLALLPGGETLVVANGGILTHPDSQREMLNLDTMSPSLVYLNVQSGALIEQQLPPHHQISLRHLAVAPTGTVLVAAQDHAPGIEDHPHPLVYQHQLGEELRELVATPQDWRQMNQYIASVALSADGRLALTSTPRGNLISLWDVAQNRLLRHFTVRDVAGAAWSATENGFLVSNGLGQLVYLRLTPELQLELASHSADLCWDNHLAPV